MLNHVLRLTTAYDLYHIIMAAIASVPGFSLLRDNENFTAKPASHLPRSFSCIEG